MKLNERLKKVQADPAQQSAAASGKPKMRVKATVADAKQTASEQKAKQRSDDPFATVKVRAQEALFAKLGMRLYDASLGEDEIQRFVADELSGAMGLDSAPLSDEERRRLALQIRDDLLGHGPIQMYLDDPSVTEVMVNGIDRIYVERDGRLTRTETRFMSEQHLRRVIDRIVTGVGRRIDESSPMVDARLHDGSRVNAVIPPLAVDGPSLTIRKFSKDPFQVDDLIEFGSLTRLVAELLEASVVGKLNILVSGGTGTGKTTLLNVLSSFIPDGDRIVTIEDAVELQLHQDHVVRLESRPANVEGRGEVRIRDLVRNSLRMRPDRIVVGECRGGEALDMLQAMNTGHDGSLSTIHANSPRDCLSRLETLVLMAAPLAPSPYQPLRPGSHGAVYFHHRRRGLLARQGADGGEPRGTAAGARLQRADSQVRPLPQRRSGHDEPLSARRGLRDRRRGRDRSRPRPLRTLHRRFGAAIGQHHQRAGSTSRSSPRSAAATISARRCR